MRDVLALFGRVGCGGLRAIKDRQYSRETTLSVQSSFDLILTVLATKPKRQYWLTHRAWSRLVVASDAAQDGLRIGSGGEEKLLLQTSKRSCLIGWPPRRAKDSLVRDVDDCTRLDQPGKHVSQATRILVHWQCRQFDAPDQRPQRLRWP